MYSFICISLGNPRTQCHMQKEMTLWSPDRSMVQLYKFVLSLSFNHTFLAKFKVLD